MDKKILNVTCAIIVKNQRVLVTQRGEQMSLPLKWEFPGGKLMDNETEEQCILREIKEELNIEIEVKERLANSFFDYGTTLVNLIPFICSHQSGRIELTEHKDAKWLNVEDLLTLDWAAADLPIVKQLLKTNYV
jgi:8-oxo-dGTP diphosphatase